MKITVKEYIRQFPSALLMRKGSSQIVDLDDAYDMMSESGYLPDDICTITDPQMLNDVKERLFHRFIEEKYEPLMLMRDGQRVKVEFIFNSVSLNRLIYEAPVENGKIYLFFRTKEERDLINPIHLISIGDVEEYYLENCTEEEALGYRSQHNYLLRERLLNQFVKDNLYSHTGEKIC